jgi:hypothetical protein
MFFCAFEDQFSSAMQITSGNHSCLVVFNERFKKINIGSMLINLPLPLFKADKFYKKWHTCPVESPGHLKRKYHEIKRGDMEKGLERLGR